MELLGISERMFRRYVVRYEVEGAEGLRDGRIGRVSPRKALEEEVRALEDLYRGRYKGRNVRHFYEAYVEDHGGERSYIWVKNRKWFLIVTMDDATGVCRFITKSGGLGYTTARAN